jgi:hypothetical protein
MKNLEYMVYHLGNDEKMEVEIQLASLSLSLALRRDALTVEVWRIPYHPDLDSPMSRLTYPPRGLQPQSISLQNTLC